MDVLERQNEWWRRRKRTFEVQGLVEKLFLVRPWVFKLLRAVLYLLVCVRAESSGRLGSGLWERGSLTRSLWHCRGLDRKAVEPCWVDPRMTSSQVKTDPSVW